MPSPFAPACSACSLVRPSCLPLSSDGLTRLALTVTLPPRATSVSFLSPVDGDDCAIGVHPVHGVHRGTNLVTECERANWRLPWLHRRLQWADACCACSKQGKIGLRQVCHYWDSSGLQATGTKRHTLSVQMDIYFQDRPSHQLAKTARVLLVRILQRIMSLS